MKSLLHISNQELTQLGVVEWGYTEENRAQSFDKFKGWINQDVSEVLPYLVDHRANIREDLKNIFPNFQSALVFHFSYAPTQKTLKESNDHLIAGYALGFEGDDYHDLLRERLHYIRDQLLTQIDAEIRSTLDIEPVLERDLSYRAGLGWFGKNSMLISQKEGSYFLIGSLLLSVKLPIEPKSKDSDHCGQCTLCVDACPTEAIDPITRTLKVQNCLSTFTIELRHETAPPQGIEKSRGEIFGCDICQDVCPWNKKKLQSIQSMALSQKAQGILQFFNRDVVSVLDEMKNWSGKSYLRFFHKTPFSRPGLKGMLKNLKSQIFVGR